MNNTEINKSPEAAPKLGVVAGSAALEWACVNNDPTEWALGKRDGNTVSPIYAVITRGPNGRWLWQILGGAAGVQPSRETAMDAVEAALPNKADMTKCEES